MQENVTMNSLRKMTTGDEEPLFKDINGDVKSLRKLNKAFRKLGKRTVRYVNKK